VWAELLLQCKNPWNKRELRYVYEVVTQWKQINAFELYRKIRSNYTVSSTLISIYILKKEENAEVRW